MENKKFYVLIGSITFSLCMLIGGIIATSILQTKWRTDAIKMALEKGQNPLYVKCALERSGESTNECNIMMTIMAASKSDK